jgi:hypothetical protein
MADCIICGFKDCQCSQEEVEDTIAFCIFLLIDKFKWTQEEVAGMFRIMADNLIEPEPAITKLH